MIERKSYLGKREKFVSFLLRAGIGFSFLYVGVMAFINPDAWIGFIPSFVEIIISRELFLIFHGILDLILGLWLLSGWKVFYASIVSGVLLFFIVIFNLVSLDVIFRDITILLAAIALGILSKDKE